MKTMFAGHPLRAPTFTRPPESILNRNHHRRCNHTSDTYSTVSMHALCGPVNRWKLFQQNCWSRSFLWEKSNFSPKECRCSESCGDFRIYRITFMDVFISGSRLFCEKQESWLALIAYRLHVEPLTWMDCGCNELKWLLSGKSWAATTASFRAH